MLLACVFVVGLLLVADPAVAWGPITHLAHGSQVLKNLTILSAGLQQLLSQHALAYLYGCVGADITVGKRYAPSAQAHCHSWKVGWSILNAAGSDRERAFAYGYLTHLAGDIYSHNHFVPIQLVVTFRTRALRHTYWEARFDSMQSHAHRTRVHKIRRQEFPECDALIERVVARTLFSFRTNKRIFDSVLAFHDWDNWHQVMRYVAAHSRYDLTRTTLRRYNQACLANILDVLRNGRKASCQPMDPAGLDTLATALDIRQTLKHLDRREALTPDLDRHLKALNRRTDLHLALSKPAAANACTRT